MARSIWTGTISFGLVSVPLLQLLRAKAKTGSVPVKETEEDEGEVVDLMQALRESVERTKRSGAKRKKKPAARKKKTAA